MSRRTQTELSEGKTFSSIALGALILFAIGGWFGNWSGNERGLWWAWSYKTDLFAGLTNVWYIFAWAFLYTGVAVAFLIRRRKPSVNSASSQFWGGLWMSVKAGVLEELVFRWLLVLSAPVLVTIVNAITFGGFRWLHLHILLPVANWATLGILEPQLHASNWVMAASILWAAGAFRNGHAYLGPVGYVNSWFIGMIMFYVVFNYGLITAMVVHFVYDAIILSIIALSVVFRPKVAPLFAMRTLFPGW